MSVKVNPNPATSGSVTGGLVYKGEYNVTTNSPDLTTSEKGDFYIVNPDAGTLAGVAVNVGDHIVFNQDAASPLTSAMFDVIDNTDAVLSVNTLTGAVVLNLKTLNDVNATLTPADGVFLVGDGSEWIGESGATARTSLGLSIGSDVQAYDAQLADIAGLTPTDGNIIVGDGSNFVAESGATARTSLGVAIGSDVQAHNAKLDDVAGLATTDGGFIVGDGSNFVLETLATARTSLGLGSAATLDAGANTANQLVQLTAAAKLPAVDGSLLTNITATDATKLAIANNLSDLNNAGTARGHLGVAIGSDVQAHNAKLDDIAGLAVTDGNIIVGDGSNFVAESGATARTSLGLSIGSDVQAYDAQLADIAGLTPTDSNIIVGDGSNFVTESGATARTSLGVAIGSDVQAHNAKLDDVAGLATTDGGFIVGDGSNFVLETLATARTSLGLGSAATLDAGANTANQLVQLTAAAKLPAVDGSLLTNITATDATKLAIANNLSDLNNAGTARGHLGVAIGSDVQAHNAKLDDVAGLAVTDGGFIVGDGSNFVLETLATARTSLGLGSAATESVGTSANNVVQLDGSARLPAVDGSQLTNLPSSGGFSYTAITSASSPVTSSTGVHYGADTSGGAITFNLPALSGLSGGEEIRIKLNTAGNNLTITANGSDTIEGVGNSTYVVSIAKESVTCVASNGTNWEIV